MQCLIKYYSVGWMGEIPGLQVISGFEGTVYKSSPRMDVWKEDRGLKLTDLLYKFTYKQEACSDPYYLVKRIKKFSGMFKCIKGEMEEGKRSVQCP